MATFSGQLRQGLPRVSGGPAWPEAGVSASAQPVVAKLLEPEPEVAEPSLPAAPQTEPAKAPAAAPAGSVDQATLRRGLPRVPGGEPWPAAGAAPAQAKPVAAEAKPVATKVPAVAEPSVVPQPTQAADPLAAANSADRVMVRQGLPRVVGGSPWPALAAAPAWAQKAKAAPQSAVAEPVANPVVEERAAEEVPAKQQELAVEKPAVAERVTAETPSPKPAPKPVPKAKREPIVLGEKTLAEWSKLTVLWGFGAVFAAAMIVLAARGVTTLPGVPEFLRKYPGEYAPAFVADPGFPAWARWSHFLNIFLMVLIIRSGMLVRTQQQPPAFWTPKKGGKKVSINLWLHTSLDILWVVNGVIFVVLLFVSGHWARIVPTSWEVVPNAASAMLQYLTLDWPTENGWVNYNALQQLMYFIIVFIAAPLAIITGVRMSEWWPEKATKLNKIYPAPLARAIHFPTMLFFVLFIIVHVFLVFSTGALRNLNHMFAGQDVVNWTGFWLFALAIALTTAGWFAARPLVLAPIANLFGRVSNR